MFRFMTRWKIDLAAELESQQVAEERTEHDVKTMLGKSGRRGLTPGHHVEAVRRS